MKNPYIQEGQEKQKESSPVFVFIRIFIIIAMIVFTGYESVFWLEDGHVAVVERKNTENSVVDKELYADVGIHYKLPLLDEVTYFTTNPDVIIKYG